MGRLRVRVALALERLADRLRASVAPEPRWPFNAGAACPKCGVREGSGGCGECGSISCPQGCRSPRGDHEAERCGECGALPGDWTWYGGGPLGPQGGPAEVMPPV